MIKKVGIINYGAGNLMSIYKAVKVFGLQPIILDKQNNNVDMLILPGVGNFGAAIKNMQQNGLFEQVIKFFEFGKPILGICLGIQLVLKNSQEAKNIHGLGLIDGKVVKFKLKNLVVPHMCWNIVKFEKEDTILLDGLKKEEYFYFVHSYYPVIKQKEIIFATSNYGINFCSMIVKNNLVATQFHLEKSGQKGLKLLENIITYFNKL